MNLAGRNMWVGRHEREQESQRSRSEQAPSFLLGQDSTGRETLPVPLDRGLLFLRKFAFQLGDNLLGDIILDGKYILELAVVVFSPQMHVCLSVDKLRAHANAAAGALHGAFHQKSCPDLLPNLSRAQRP